LSADRIKLDDQLSDDDLAQMVSASDDKESLLRPLKELSRRKSPRRLEIFQQLLENPQQQSTVKRIVSARLGTEALPENQEMLLQQLNTDDSLVLMAVARSLGKIGDEQALESLRRTQPRDDVAANAFEFARSLIAHRLRLNSELISIPLNASVVKVTEEVPVKVTTASSQTIKKAIAQSKEDLPAISLNRHGAAKIVCNANEMLLIFTDEFYKWKELETLRDRPAIPCVLLSNDSSSERYYLDGYFFTNPSANDEISLWGTRPQGDLTYVGRIKVADHRIAFSLNSIDSRYVAPVEIEGWYSQDSGWTFEKAITGTQVASTATVRTPRRLRPTLE
jgi:hypothetical protein